jgi:cephalosporin hydroxylase
MLDKSRSLNFREGMGRVFERLRNALAGPFLVGSTEPHLRVAGRRSHLALPAGGFFHNTYPPQHTSSTAAAAAPCRTSEPEPQCGSYMEESLDAPLRAVLARAQRHICEKATYCGIPTQKCPNDWWVYQEIIYELKPTVIVEIGNFRGGSALALADVQNRFGSGKVLAVDIDHSGVDERAKRDPRISWITGDAVSVYGKVKAQISAADTVMVIDDSAHTYENTIDVLRMYSEDVTIGSYFIVEDGICFHGVDEGPKPGPYEAITDFLKENRDFSADREREGFFITWNPKGFLKRTR